MKTALLLPAALLALGLPAVAAREPFRLPSPRTYSGVLPCSDCEGTRVTLDLFPDGVFVSREETLGKGGSSVDLGRWSVTKDGSLSLRGGAGTVLYWPAPSGALRRLDEKGREIPSTKNLELKPEAAFRMVEGSLSLSGQLSRGTYESGLKPCLTGQTLPFLPGDEAAAMEKAYEEKRTAPGAQVFVTFTGRLSLRPAAEGSEPRLAVVVEKLERVAPGEPCPPTPGTEVEPEVPRSPEGRTWKLVRLSGQVVEGPDSRRAAYLELDRGRKSFAGSTGCNKLAGRYQLQGEELSFLNVATRRAGCKDGSDREERLLEALGKVTRWKISGDRLTLYAGRDAVLELREAELD